MYILLLYILYTFPYCAMNGGGFFHFFKNTRMSRDLTCLWNWFSAATEAVNKLFSASVHTGGVSGALAKTHSEKSLQLSTFVKNKKIQGFTFSFIIISYSKQNLLHCLTAELNGAEADADDTSRDFLSERSNLRQASRPLKV